MLVSWRFNKSLLGEDKTLLGGKVAVVRAIDLTIFTFKITAIRGFSTYLSEIASIESTTLLSLNFETAMQSKYANLNKSSFHGKTFFTVFNNRRFLLLAKNMFVLLFHSKTVSMAKHSSQCLTTEDLYFSPKQVCFALLFKDAFHSLKLCVSNFTRLGKTNQ